MLPGPHPRNLPQVNAAVWHNERSPRAAARYLRRRHRAKATAATVATAAIPPAT